MATTDESALHLLLWPLGGLQEARTVSVTSDLSDQKSDREK